MSRFGQFLGKLALLYLKQEPITGDGLLILREKYKRKKEDKYSTHLCKIKD